MTRGELRFVVRARIPVAAFAARFVFTVRLLSSDEARPGEKEEKRERHTAAATSVVTSTRRAFVALLAFAAQIF